MLDAASASGSSAASSDDEADSSEGSGEWVMLDGALAPNPKASAGAARSAPVASDGAPEGRRKKKRRRPGSSSDDDFDADVFAPAEDYADAIARADGARGGGVRNGRGGRDRNPGSRPRGGAAGANASPAGAAAAPGLDMRLKGRGGAAAGMGSQKAREQGHSGRPLGGRSGATPRGSKRVKAGAASGHLPSARPPPKHGRAKRPRHK